jgi:hypothetical protein
MPPEVLTPKSLGGLPVRKVIDTVTDRTINMMIYGAAGIGKTVLGGSADEVPELRPVLDIDFEGGTMPLEKRYPNVQTLRITASETDEKGVMTGEGWKRLQAVYDDLLRQCHRGTCEYRTVMIDSLSELQKLCMYDIMYDLVQKKDNREIDVPDIREWGINLERVRRMVRGFRDLPLNTIFVCHQQIQTNKRTGKGTTLPSLTGKMSQEIAGFLDIVIYLYAKELDDQETHRIALTGSTEDIVAKDRSDTLPLTIIDPTMKKIFDTINGVTSE